MACRVWVWAGVLMVGAVASAQESATFKQNVSAGMSWKFDQSQDSNLDNTATFQGRQQQFAVKNRQHRAGTVEVLEAANGEPTKLKLTFDPDCGATQEMNGQSQKMPFPYAGQTVTITKDAGGVITDDFNGQADPTNQLELHEYFDQDQQLYPKTPIKVGEEWSGDPKVLGRVLGLNDPRDRGGMTCKLLDIKNDGGKRVANVKVSLAVFKFDGQLQTQLVSQGTAQVDLATGHAIGTELKGTIELSGKQQTPGQDGQPMSFDMQGKGTMDVQSTSPISGGGELTPTPIKPDEPVVTGDNPLSPGEADAFAGSYSDGKLTAVFRKTGGGYTGSITLGGKKYPALANKSADGYDGSFNTSPTSSFPFKAKLIGETMTLSTGNSKYVLKKAEANINPLDAGAAPVNPLAPGN